MYTARDNLVAYIHVQKLYQIITIDFFFLMKATIINYANLEKINCTKRAQNGFCKSFHTDPK
jgi:hypothetical protein